MKSTDILKKYGITDEALGAALDEIVANKITIPIVLEEGAAVPAKATSGSAAFDLILAEDTEVKDGRFLAKTSIRFKLPEGYAAIIKPRSGHTLKGMEALDRFGNSVRIEAHVNDGVIDSDYIGLVGILMQSHGLPKFHKHTIKKGTHIAQLLIVKVADAEWVVVDKLEETERGEGGYGHSTAGKE